MLPQIRRNAHPAQRSTENKLIPLKVSASYRWNPLNCWCLCGKQRRGRQIKASVSDFKWRRATQVKSKHPRDTSSMSVEWSGHNEPPSQATTAGWWENPLHIISLYSSVWRQETWREAVNVWREKAPGVLVLYFLRESLFCETDKPGSRNQKLAGIWFVLSVKVSHQVVRVGECRHRKQVLC